MNKSNTTPTSVELARLHEEHPEVRAQDWRSPLVFRLMRKRRYSNGKVSISDSFRGEDTSEMISQLSMKWSGLKEDFQQCINTYQEPVLTEFATLGLACVLLTKHTDFRLSEVTRRGQSVDYWLGCKSIRKRFVLEVGGQQDGSIETLSGQKTQQLADNPWGRDGFICVAIYNELSARLWFCPQDGAK